MTHQPQPSVPEEPHTSLPPSDTSEPAPGQNPLTLANNRLQSSPDIDPRDAAVTAKELEISGMPLEPHQAIIQVRSFAPFDEFGAPFLSEGDDRGFSTEVGPTSRITTAFLYDAEEGSLSILMNDSYVSRTHALGWRDGPHISLEGSGLLDGQSTPQTKLHFEETGDGTSFDIHISGAHGGIPGAPSIDIHLRGNLVSTPEGIGIEIEAVGDGFPNLEVFGRAGDGATQPIIMFQTDAGKSGPITHLPRPEDFTFFGVSFRTVDDMSSSSVFLNNGREDN